MSKAVIHGDNKLLLFHAFRRGKARDTMMHKIVSKLFRLQWYDEFTFDIRWVCSVLNNDADDPLRPEATGYTRSEHRVFYLCWISWVGFDMDGMITLASFHAVLASSPGASRQMPCSWRYHAKGSSGVDVMSHDVNKITAVFSSLLFTDSDGRSNVGAQGRVRSACGSGGTGPTMCHILCMRAQQYGHDLSLSRMKVEPSCGTARKGRCLSRGQDGRCASSRLIFVVSEKYEIDVYITEYIYNYFV